MFRIKRRRTLIRLITFGSAAFIVAVGLAVTGLWMSYKLKMDIEYSYQRSLSDLADQMKNLEMDLQKAQYAGTTTQLAVLSGKIRSEALAAKTDLSQISITDVNFDKTQKFIAQLADYANSLSRSITEQNKLTDKDREMLSMLLSTSHKLSEELDNLVSDVQYGKLTLYKSNYAIGNLAETKTKPASSIELGFQNIEENMSGVPAMIYDGPFSDNVLKKVPEFTKGKPAVSRKDAKNVAASFLNLSPNALKDDGETGGNLPTYNFKTSTKNIYVSKNGGMVVRVIDSRQPKESKLSNEQAVNKANQFVSDKKLGNFKVTYNLTDNNICVVNFAFLQDNVICYPDLIKVGIALDNGEILSYDATGFIMNHKNRTFPAISVSKERAQSMLNPSLKVSSVSLALIPRDGVKEVLCYEFKCKGKADNKVSGDVIDYFNVTNGIEEQILILKQTPGGVLAM
ncbi:germination protein YpeB [[Clostridium] cellulosi]|jgi:germination protein YpeB|uniref:Germination protein YpeB n=1 Tax=[Clostridium] cellulosi TaxID=29343 RepID=A0A078KMI0_9FIRM|nr:germination protein YpeB [[Clostridium] cellulosi]